VVRWSRGASFGWLGKNALPTTPLAELPFEFATTDVALAVGTEGGLGARAALLGNGPGSEGEITTVRLDFGKPPSVRRVELKGHGVLGARVLAVASISLGRWMILYQGGGPRPSVHTVTIDGSGSALAEPATLMDDASAGRAAALGAGAHAFAVLTLRAPGGAELFVTRLECSGA
jgi:hypothetical protein